MKTEAEIREQLEKSEKSLDEQRRALPAIPIEDKEQWEQTIATCRHLDGIVQALEWVLEVDG